MDLNRFDKCWFAIQVRPRYEFIVASVFRSKGFEEFLPSYKSKRQWSDRQKEIELPLFPSYVFCRFDARIQVPILTTPGVIRIIGVNSAIPDSEIEAIQAVVARGLPTTPCPYLNVGARVHVIAGPLTGAQGILVVNNKQHRLILSVTLVQNSISVEVERSHVTLLPEAAHQTIQAQVPGVQNQIVPSGLSAAV